MGGVEGDWGGKPQEYEIGSEVIAGRLIGKGSQSEKVGGAEKEEAILIARVPIDE